nr:TaqI-like C-terminal specificity domain-containing protein [Candidatus Sigynarchaeota archaeon]
MGTLDKILANYELIKEKLSKGFAFPVNVLEEERDSYATTIVNRIVFTIFLQVRNPITGMSIIPEHFLQDLFEKGRTMSCFQSLCKLWFDYFNNDTPRISDDGIFEQIPYLDCGLFAPIEGIEIDGGKILYNTITVPDATWKDVVNFIDEYPWTIIEKDDDTAEGLITPSIIGHIHEKTCNQKETGSYYTPDHVTMRIARACISRHVTHLVNEQFKTRYVDFLDTITKDGFDSTESLHVAWAREHVLDNISICDNACGSGAFLVAAERVLASIHQACDALCGPKETPRSLYTIKRHVITRNLFGVDIQPGPVEAAKMRLWLSLIASMEQGDVGPLPNIDGNILSGNSLTGFVKLPSNAWGKTLLSDRDRLKTLHQSFSEKTSELAHARSSGDRAKARMEVRAIQDQIRKLLDELFIEEIESTTGHPVLLTHLVLLKPFHWGFEFKEIFDNGGFDIITGNPPYVRQEAIKHFIPGYDYKGMLHDLYNPMVIDEHSKDLKLGSTVDLSLYFMLRGIQKLKPGGVLSYIITTKWLRSAYGKPVRHFLKHNTSISAIHDFTGKAVFRGIGVDTLVFTTAKDKPGPGHVFRYSEPGTLADFSTGTTTFLQEQLDDESWTFVKTEWKEISRWMDEKGIALVNNDVNINFGIKTGLNEAFIIDDGQRKELIKHTPAMSPFIKPMLRGKDITQYKISWKHLWLINVRHGHTNAHRGDEGPEAYMRRVLPFLMDHLDAVKKSIDNGTTRAKGKGLEQRDDQGEYWWELRPCAYDDDFQRPKIVIKDMSNFPPFCFDEQGFYGNTAMYMITPRNATRDHMLFLVLLLNSGTAFFRFKQFASKLGKKGFRFWKESLERIPVASPGQHTTLLARLSEMIHYATARNLADALFLTELAGTLVQELYFHSKFYADGIYPEDVVWITSLLEPCIEPILFKKWDELRWKQATGEINLEETRTLADIIKHNDSAIASAVQFIKADTTFQSIMGIIRKHPWCAIINEAAIVLPIARENGQEENKDT